MTAHQDMEVLTMEDVDAAKVGQIVATLEHVGRQHAAVVDQDEDGNERLRGLFSGTQITRQLGLGMEDS